MLYLIACENDLKQTLKVNCTKFSESIYVSCVSYYKHEFYMEKRDVYLFVIITGDGRFIDKLQTLCDFKCILNEADTAKTVSLYRVVGIEERQHYEKMLKELSFKFIDDIVVRCRNCGHCGQCDDLGNDLIWIEWHSNHKLSTIVPQFNVHFDHVFCYRFI